MLTLCKVRFGELRREACEAFLRRNATCTANGCWQLTYPVYNRLLQLIIRGDGPAVEQQLQAEGWNAEAAAAEARGGCGCSPPRAD
jgi:hypothetical protein